MNHTPKTAHLNRCSRASQPISGVMFGRPLCLPPPARRQSVTGYCDTYTDQPAPMAERFKALSCPLAVIARRSLCPEKLGSNPGQGSKGINFSGWHGLDMSVTVTKRR